MKKLHFASAAVLGLLAFIAWGVTRKFERWVVPSIVGNVVDSSGRAIELDPSEIRVTNEAIGDLDISMQGVGRFNVAPKKAMLRSYPGYGCTDTRLCIRAEGYKPVCRVLQLCSGERLVDYPVLEFEVNFRLAAALEQEKSTTNVTRIDRYLESVTSLD